MRFLKVPNTQLSDRLCCKPTNHLYDTTARNVLKVNKADGTSNGNMKMFTFSETWLKPST